MVTITDHADCLEDIGSHIRGTLLAGSVDDASALRSELLVTLADFAATEDEWRELYASSPSASTPLSYEWMSAWWKLYGADYGRSPGGLRVLAVRKGAKLVGIAPFYVKKRRFLSAGRMGFLSSGESESDATCAEYLDVLFIPEEREGVFAEVLRFLFETTCREWNDLALSLVGASSMSASVFEAAPKKFVRRSSSFVSHVADLSGGFDAYLSRLSANARQQFRRLIRDSTKEGVEFEVAETAQEAQSYLAELITLHQRRWNSIGKRGAFSSERAVAFHNEVLSSLHPRGEAVITRVRVHGSTVAVIYGFVKCAKFDFYQSGITLESTGPLKRPGILAHLLTMRYLASREVTAYDFLAGDSEYKARMATREQELRYLTLAKPSLATFFKSAELRARRLMRGGLSGLAAFVAT